MEKENVSRIFFIFTSVYITLILVSNILAERLISLAGISLTGAVIVFPFTYILSDIFTEIYGFNKNKSVIWLSFMCNLIMVIIFVFVLKLPYPKTFENSEAYNIVLGTTPRNLVASLIGFLFGNFLNSIILSKLKVTTKGKYLALRTILSTIVGEVVDTLIFITIAFWGQLPNEIIGFMIINQSILKILIEVLFTPITYKVIRKVKKIEGFDVYDNNVKYNIFKR
ncbi:MAG TPA: transporter [Clostridiales bacterium]|nr:transporter [Clostridiales bacterium]